ncbi:LAQU0S10e02476g1_1 [Lachancea quebecensis]|uniref:LAQU0S10e02476g1_1 n=1 Tax=Lachancea quebecensis TaxID=1654605 RepID=A0A0P1KUH1_9SACH|nr:LAQU0S10e02476g1_1 [Lachancea quebecensis]
MLMTTAGNRIHCDLTLTEISNILKNGPNFSEKDKGFEVDTILFSRCFNVWLQSRKTKKTRNRWASCKSFHTTKLHYIIPAKLRCPSVALLASFSFFHSFILLQSKIYEFVSARTVEPNSFFILVSSNCDKATSPIHQLESLHLLAEMDLRYACSYTKASLPCSFVKFQVKHKQTASGAKQEALRSVMPLDTEPTLENPEESHSINSKIFRAVADVFQNAQSTYAGHRRHIAVLKRIQAKAVEQGYEEVFNYWFDKMVTLVLPLKRTEPVGDRIVRLVGGFISSIEHDLEAIDDKQNRKEQEEVFARFVDQFVRHMLRGIESRDKNVRYRVTQLLAIIMDNIGEIDEELYNLLMWSFQKRVYDKESFVRIQSIFCLTKFQDDESVSEAVDDATSKLMHAIQNDPSAEVRRAAMLNIVNTPNTKRLIMERARDVNPINRRLVYSRVLRAMGLSVFEEIGVESLDKLINWGLEDREETVRVACARLVSFDWLNLMDGDIIKLLAKLDVTTSNVCEKAMDAIFKYRNDTITKIKLPEDVWENLTAETSFLIKAFHFHCTKNHLDDVIDSNFPEASKLSEILKKYIDLRFVQSGLSAIDKLCLDFILQQLLSVAFNFDYSDEIGRRAMLIVIRNTLASYKLNPSLVQICLKVLEVLSINERDFITMTVEIITDIRDEDIEKQEAEEAKKIQSTNANLTDEDEDEDVESFHSAIDDLVNGNETPERSSQLLAQEKEVSSEALLACLTMSRYMLELVDSPLNENIMITTLIDTLITPAVRNTQPEVRELGVRTLGLCCLLDVGLAAESLYLLGMCVSKGDANLKNTALKVIVDIFSIHGTKVVDGEGKVDSISLHKIFYKILKNCELPSCQATVAEGLCKLFLGDVFMDDDLFETLVLSYFSPANSKNEALVQAFAFCLPVYCFSHLRHQRRMVRVAGDVLLRLSVLWDDIQTNEDESLPPSSMLKPSVIFQELIEWTDSTKLVNKSSEFGHKEDTQLDFLLSVLKMYYKLERKDLKKMILTNISRFNFEDDNTLKWREAHEILEDILDNDDIDSASRNAVSKFTTLIKNFLATREESDQDVTKNEASEDEEEISSILHTGTSMHSVDNSQAAESTDIVDGDQLPDLHQLGETNDTTEEHIKLSNRKRKRLEEESGSERPSDPERSSRMVSFVLPEDCSMSSEGSEDCKSDDEYNGE